MPGYSNQVSKSIRKKLLYFFIVGLNLVHVLSFSGFEDVEVEIWTEEQVGGGRKLQQVQGLIDRNIPKHQMA